MSYFRKSFADSKNKIKVELDWTRYATKSD